MLLKKGAFIDEKGAELIEKAGVEVRNSLYS